MSRVCSVALQEASEWQAREASRDGTMNRGRAGPRNGLRWHGEQERAQQRRDVFENDTANNLRRVS